MVHHVVAAVAITRASVADPNHGHTIGPGFDQQTDSIVIFLRALYDAEINPPLPPPKKKKKDLTVCLFVLFDGLCFAESFKSHRSC